jgi:CheY-like chemotaxis protein
MGGIELARAVRDRHAELPILLLSGYAASTIGPDLAGQALHFLPKPYSPEALVAAVRKALGIE